VWIREGSKDRELWVFDARDADRDCRPNSDELSMGRRLMAVSRSCFQRRSLRPLISFHYSFALLCRLTCDVTSGCLSVCLSVCLRMCLMTCHARNKETETHTHTHTDRLEPVPCRSEKFCIQVEPPNTHTYLRHFITAACLHRTKWNLRALRDIDCHQWCSVSRESLITSHHQQLSHGSVYLTWLMSSVYC